ncbi:MAG: hypothetical protein K2G51_15515 [Lachnospiraceae bacterium]|nr:hypothetical protein [Lachnospiraceae bacterium]
MLLIQKICLQWGKGERGAEGEQVRRQFLWAYPLEPQAVQGDVLIQNLNFYQKKSTILNAIQEEYYLSEKYYPQWGYTPGRIQRETQDRIAWIKRYQYQNYSSVNAINLANLSVSHRDGRFDITFFYDEHRSGAPFRRGHNKDYWNPDSPFYATDVLNETAFVLSPGQYGQILWNERRTDFDNGTWYYQLHIYNMYYLSGETVPNDIFTTREPDYTYQQLALLY